MGAPAPVLYRKEMFLMLKLRNIAIVFRVYLKTHDVTGSEGFLRCARHFFAGILTYFKEK